MTVAEKKSRFNCCFARRHMPPGVFAYYAYALAVSRDTGVFYSDDRRDAEEFGERGISNRTVFGFRQWLEKHLWFVRADRGRRKKRNPKTGVYESIRYKVFDHDEWAAAHSGNCRFPASQDDDDIDSPAANSASGPDATSTSGKESLDVDSSRRNFFQHQTQLLHSPDADSAAKTVKRERKEETEKDNAAPQNGAAPLNNIERSLSQKLELFLKVKLRMRNPVRREDLVGFLLIEAAKLRALDSLDVDRILEATRVRMGSQ